MNMFCFAICLTALIACTSCASVTETVRYRHLPYQVSLRHKALDKHFCSGAILSEDWIVTVARCVANYDIHDFYVNYGVQRFNANSGNNEIKFKVVHSEFNGDDAKNDIAMLLMAEKIEFHSNAISTVGLPKAPAVADDVVTLSGWAWESNHYGERAKCYLWNMETKILAKDECREWSGIFHRLVVNENTLCTVNNSSKLYDGDHGSLLVSQSNELMGIGLWFTAMEEIPDIFLAIYPYVQWIESVLLYHDDFNLE